MATLNDLERSFLIVALGLPADIMATLNDLRRLYYLNPPAPGGGGDPPLGGDLSGLASAAQIVPDAVGTTEIINLAVTDAKVATANKDGVAGTPSMRTLGTGAQQAAPGNTVELSANKGAVSGYAGLGANQRVPVANLGSGTANATTYLAGDQSYKDPAVGGDLTGTISNAQIGAGTVGATEASSAIEKTANKGAASGYAALDASSLLALANLPAGSTLIARKVSGNWPGGTSSTGVRPTARSDVTVIWMGADPSPAIVASGTAGMLDNIDVRWITT